MTNTMTSPMGEGGFPAVLNVRARAAAHLLLKANIIRYDAVASTPFTLDLAGLDAAPDCRARLVDMIADVLYALDPDDAYAASNGDRTLVETLATRLHLPKMGRDGTRIVTVAWCASSLPANGGFALFDDRLGTDQPSNNCLCLTTWSDVLEVMHMAGYGDAKARFALAAAIKPESKNDMLMAV